MTPAIHVKALVALVKRCSLKTLALGAESPLVHAMVAALQKERPDLLVTMRDPLETDAGSNADLDTDTDTDA